MLENGGPIFPGVPRDFARRVDLNGHDLANTGTLNDDNQCADTAVLTTPLFTSLDISDNDRIANVRARNNVRSCNGETNSETRTTTTESDRVPTVHERNKVWITH